ncbi:hypothetical protein H4R34_004492 [Dimargaris verticillata]|uniref:F-box domain-containing protein n=1 Tax=Dimargaris verticillata TaxID=2761393 RepID=A0A9W8EB35_9FUNG|nr:hypothetical protein H4R34_004492 [Dimargaris verticillata]
MGPMDPVAGSENGLGIPGESGALMESVFQPFDNAWTSDADPENGAQLHKGTLLLRDICRLTYVPESWETEGQQCTPAETTPFKSLVWASDRLDQRATCVRVKVDNSAAGICDGKSHAEAAVPVVVVANAAQATLPQMQSLSSYIKLGLKEYKAVRHYPIIYMMCLVSLIRLADARGIELTQRVLLCALALYTNVAGMKAAANKIREAYHTVVATTSLANAVFVPEQGTNTVGTSASMNEASVDAIKPKQRPRLLSLPTELTIDIINSLPMLDMNQFEGTARLSQRLVYDVKNKRLSKPYSFRELAIPSFAEPWIFGGFNKDFQQGTAQWGLSHLDMETGELVTVIEALVVVVNSAALLDNFELIAAQASQAQQGHLDRDSNRHALTATGPAQPHDFGAFMYRFWLVIIGGNSIDQLRYYLNHVLANQVIPNIFVRLLESDKHAEALALARGVSRIHGLARAARAYPANALNYFELIVLYVTSRRCNGFEVLVRDIHDAGSIDLQSLYWCYEGYERDSWWSIFETIIPLQPPPDPIAWQRDNRAQCTSLKTKYARFVGVAQRQS